MIPIASQPEYAKIFAEITILNEAQGKVSLRISEIEALLRANTPDDGSAHVEAALHFANTGKVLVPGGGIAELSEEHVILRDQRDALTKAVTEKHRDLEKVARVISAEVCKDTGPTHRVMAGRYLALLKQLDAIAEEELALISSLERNGYNVNFREYIRWPVIGLLRESSGATIWHKVKELNYYGTQIGK